VHTRVIVSPVLALEPLADEWEELAERAGAGPFVRPGWITAWAEAFGADGIGALTVRRAGRLATLLPLRHDDGIVSSPTNDHTPEFGLLAEDASARSELVDSLLALESDRISLEFLDGAGADFALCRDRAESEGYRVLVRAIAYPPYLAIDGDWERFERTLAGSFLRDVRRRRRHLEQEGTVTVEVSNGSDRLDELLAEGFAVEASGWKAESKTAIASRLETRRFYTAMAQWSAERGWLRLAFLRLDRRPIAFQLGLEHGGAYYFLKGGYDPAYRRYSPGKLLVHAMLARAFADGLARYELLGDLEPWKLEWTRTVRIRARLTAFDRSPRGLLDWATAAYARPLASRVLRHRARMPADA